MALRRHIREYPFYLPVEYRVMFQLIYRLRHRRLAWRLVTADRLIRHHDLPASVFYDHRHSTMEPRLAIVDLTDLEPGYDAILRSSGPLTPSDRRFVFRRTE